MSRCFFREFAPAGLRECDGKVQRHHMIRQQVIKRMLAPGRSHLMLDDELRDAKANLNRALNDPRNLLDVCKRHHDLWHERWLRQLRGSEVQHVMPDSPSGNPAMTEETCHEWVPRGDPPHGPGDGDPCGRPATGWAWDEEGGGLYPACLAHETGAGQKIAQLRADPERARLVEENERLRRLLWRSVNRRQSPRLRREVDAALSSVSPGEERPSPSGEDA